VLYGSVIDGHFWQGTSGGTEMNRYLLLGLLVLGVLTISCGEDTPTTPSQSTSPPSSSPQPSTALTGFVRETAPTETVPVAGARVEVLDAESGKLTGNFVLSDSRGFYEFPGLTGSISFRASKAGYEGDPDRIHLQLTRTLDFNIMPNSRKPPREHIAVGQSRTGSLGRSESTCGGMYFNLACKRFVLAIGTETLVSARLSWPSRHDLDLALWRDDEQVVYSATCQACGIGTSEETVTTTLSAGEYELRVTYFWDNDGSATSFSLNVM
jgi:hypothetical protein